jgi:hypothetical protein
VIARLSRRTFYRVRRGVRSQLAVLAPEPVLETPLKAILHKDQWDRVWTVLLERRLASSELENDEP